MPRITVSMEINASPELVYYTAHYQSEKWDPFGTRIYCIHCKENVTQGNRQKIISWHRQSMIVEYIHVSAPSTVAMKMLKGPYYLKKFAGTWQFKKEGNNKTLACWYYYLQAAKKFRYLEPFMMIYFKWESRRRLNALARLCEQAEINNIVR